MFARKLGRGRYTVKANRGSNGETGALRGGGPAWLVLGGGALKGLAHIGVWRAVRELGIPVEGIVGTSIGAIVGAGLATGRDPEDLASRARALRRKDIVRLNWKVFLPMGVRQRGLFRGRVTRRFIRNLLNDADWSDLVMPLSVNAVDLGSGRAVWFGEGGRTDLSLPDAAYASSALPVLYPPLERADEVLVDGGLLDTLAIRRAVELGAERIVAVNAGAGPEADAHAILSHGVVGLSQRMFVIMSEQRRRDELARTHSVPVTLVRPRLDDIDGFDFSKVEYFLDEGYRAGMEVLGGRDPSGPSEIATAPDP